MPARARAVQWVYPVFHSTRRHRCRFDRRRDAISSWPSSGHVSAVAGSGAAAAGGSARRRSDRRRDVPSPSVPLAPPRFQLPDLRQQRAAPLDADSTAAATFLHVHFLRRHQHIWSYRCCGDGRMGRRFLLSPVCPPLRRSRALVFLLLCHALAAAGAATASGST